MESPNLPSIRALLPAWNKGRIYEKTGNLRAGQLLLCHTKMHSTVRYLVVELEDALAIAEDFEI